MPKTSRQNTAQSPRLPRDAARLVKLCQDLHASGSRLEDQFWEKKIDALLGKLFKSSQDSTLESALEHLSEHHPDAFEVLLEQIETRTESFTAVHNEASYDALLVTAPLAVWTRYQASQGLVVQQRHGEFDQCP